MKKFIPKVCQTPVWPFKSRDGKIRAKGYRLSFFYRKQTWRLNRDSERIPRSLLQGNLQFI
jgi:hypothetical protein